MKRVVGGLLAVLLVGLLLPAVAGAQRPHAPYIPGPNPTVLKGYCPGFTAIVTFSQFNQYIIQDTTNPVTGVETLRITGHARATVTNATTSKSVTYNISGPATVVINPDGSFSANAAGPNLLWTTRANLANFPDVPTISYTTGHVSFAVDATGQTTSYSLAGGARQTDVCAVLAS